VFSIYPPHGALDVARALAGFGGIVVDANAISPRASLLIGRTVTGGGARYVDGGIIGPPPVTAGTTRLYLAGDDGEVASLFAGSALDVVSLAGAPPAASALKMTYAAWTKTTAALLVAIRDTAAAYGVDVDLATEWAISQPHLAEAWRHARDQSQQKGWRWQDLRGRRATRRIRRRRQRGLRDVEQSRSTGAVDTSRQPDAAPAVSPALLPRLTPKHIGIHGHGT
jgi:hypothetical protein